MLVDKEETNFDLVDDCRKEQECDILCVLRENGTYSYRNRFVPIQDPMSNSAKLSPIIRLPNG